MNLSKISWNQFSLRAKIMLILFSFMIPMSAFIQFFVIPLHAKKVEFSKRDQTRVSVEIIHTLLMDSEAKVKSGFWTLGQAQAFIKSIVKTIRYNETEYFWINDTKARIISHGMKNELDEKDMSQMTDPNGVKIFVEFVNAVNKDESHSGFVDYFWPRAKDPKPVPKISYVKLFQP